MASKSTSLVLLCLAAGSARLGAANDGRLRGAPGSARAGATPRDMQRRRNRNSTAAALGLEHRHRLAQARRLVLQTLRRRRRFFHQRRVLLRGFVHLRDRPVHLFDPLALFRAGGADLAHDVGHPLHRVHHFVHRVARLLHQFVAVRDLVGRVADQAFDFLRRRRAALRETAHFPRDHGEAAALVRRPAPLPRRR
jgi:hypothetical protein